MTKEFEALEKIDNTLCLNWNNGYLEFGLDTDNHCDISSHKEMIECLEQVNEALQEKQDLERFTRLVVEKRVAMDLITNEETKDYIKYNSHCDKYDFIVPLTEEEFTFIKEMIKKYGKRI